MVKIKPEVCPRGLIVGQLDMDLIWKKLTKKNAELRNKTFIWWFRDIDNKWNAFRSFYIWISDGSGTEKVGFGRVREFPKFENSGSGM